MDVSKAKSVLIIPNPNNDEIAWKSAIALYHSLKTTNKKVELFSENSPKNWKTIVDEQEIRKYKDKIDNTIKVTISNINSEIKSLNWKKEGGNLEIQIILDKVHSNGQKLELKRNVIDFDLKIFVGLIRSEAEKIKIIKQKNFTTGTCVFLKSNSNDGPLTIQIMRFIKNAKLSFNEKTAKPLLEAIYVETVNFTRYKSAEIFETASILSSQTSPSDGSSNSINSKNRVTSSTNIERDEFAIQTMESDDTNTSENSDLITEENKQKTSINKSIKSPEIIYPKGDSQIKSNTNKNDSAQMASSVPQNIDPLAPATSLPTPLILEKDSPAPVKTNGPLPEAANS